MKKVLYIIKYLIFFIIGNILFNLIFSITQNIILNIHGLDRNIIGIFLENFKNNLIAYAILFIIILLLKLSYNIYLTKKLNKSLEKVKGRENYEE